MQEKESIINHDFGNPFNRIMILSAYLLIPIAIMSVLTANFFASIIFAIISAYILLSRKGISFNPSVKTYKNYIALLDYKKGEEKSYAAYPDLAILRKRIVTQALSRGNAVSTIEDQWQYHLCLLDAKHRKRILVKTVLDESQAKKEAAEWAEQLGVNYVVYNPVISEQTRRRRR